MFFKKSFFLILVLFSGCAYMGPVVQDFNIVSIPQEIEIGNQMAATVSRQMRLVEDPLVVGRVRAIGNRLILQLPSRNFPYRFYVVDDKTPNAFTIPGGAIYVHTGLLDFVDDESELAGVLAHEIGHAAARHPARALSREYGVEYLSNLIFPENKKRLQTLALDLARTGFLMHYSRADELEADAIGFQLLKRADFRSDVLLRFLKKIQQLERGGFSVPFFNTHPPTQERVARLEAMEMSGEGTALSLPGPTRRFY